MLEAQSLRFVVLHHTGVHEAHYDLLIETAADAPLRSWRCDAWPLASGARVTATLDHRRAYLEYEGAISGNRGQVARVDQGSCCIEVDGSDEFRVQLGRADPTMLHLKLLSKDTWIASTCV